MGLIMWLLMWWTGTLGPARYNGRGMDWDGGWYVLTRLMLPIVPFAFWGISPETGAISIPWLLGTVAYYVAFFGLGAMIVEGIDGT